MHRVAAHEHGQLGKLLFRDVVLVHVARCDQCVVRRNGRAQRNFVDRVADLRQGLHGGVTALAREPILAGDHQHVARNTRVDQMMRQHRHREASRATDLDRMRVNRAQTEVLDERRRQHQVRERRRVAAQQTVDILALELRVGERGGRRIAHQIERRAARQLAVGRETDPCDVTHAIESSLSMQNVTRERVELPTCKWVGGASAAGRRRRA